jgi:nucleotidyltransferase substrate binding protein (TIGR01987 family)
MSQDIRWIQRFSSYQNALAQLTEAVELFRERGLSKLEKQGLIQCFEYTHELAWKTLKDFLEQKGSLEMFGSRDVIKEAFKLGIIKEGEIWMFMIKSRNLTSHIYDEKTVDEIVDRIITLYFPEFKVLCLELDHLKKRESDV